MNNTIDFHLPLKLEELLMNVKPVLANISKYEVENNEMFLAIALIGQSSKTTFTSSFVVYGPLI